VALRPSSAALRAPSRLASSSITCTSTSRRGFVRSAPRAISLAPAAMHSPA